MKILITGVCGFAGGTLARALVENGTDCELMGFDNLIRPGSEVNRTELKKLGVRFFHADARSASDLDALPACDWVIDAAAVASVLAGVDGHTGSRQLVEHNLTGTVNLLEYCRRHRAGFILLSTSRVYSISPLASLPVIVQDRAYTPDVSARLPDGLTAAGVSEKFSTTAPISLYGATKLASEALALEYGETYGFPVFINRCGVLAGAGQFGRPDQGIFSYWIHAWRSGASLAHIGFDGLGHQVRDCLHPRDLVEVLRKQFVAPRLAVNDRVLNFSGGANNAMSLRQLGDWCADRFGPRSVASEPTPRPFDVPWLVLAHARASQIWGWQAQTRLPAVLTEIAAHAEAHPEWLGITH